MGEVWLAQDARLGRKVALKVLRRSGPERAARLLTEARLTAQLAHPHIVTTYDVGEHGGSPWIALEYLEGEDLRERLAQGPLAPREVMRLGEALASALAHAHAHGVLHLDLKPSNAVVGRDGRLRVLDFGLGRVHGEGAEGGGTPGYMAPEQWERDEPTPATDVWALGVTLHELLAGRTPWADLAGAVSGEARRALLGEAASRDDLPLRLPDGVPPPLVAMIGECLHRDPASRPSAAEVHRRLVALLRPQTEARGECPFRGLRPFEEDHAAAFFGREPEVDALVERLRSEPTVAVVGPSGSGKSSFVLAGVVPRLRDQGAWRVLRLRPGRQPLRALSHALDRAEATLPTGDDTTLSPAVDGDDPWAQPPAPPPDLESSLLGSPAVLGLCLRRLAAHAGCRVLVVVDQLEELVTQGAPQAEVDAFLAALEQAADVQDPVRVLLTIRDDFLGLLAGGALSRVMVLRPLGAHVLAAGLERAARWGGVAFEDGLVQAMVAEVSTEIAALPLLQFTALQLWERRDVDTGLLRARDHEALGGVAGALASHADRVLAGLDEQRIRTTRQLLLTLVHTDGTRRSQPVADLEAVAGRELLDRLLESRLVVSRRLTPGGPAEVELAHDSLAQTWTLLRRWLAEARDEVRLASDLEEAAALWSRRGERDEELWRGNALVEARRARDDLPLGPVARRFLEASVARAATQERRRRLARTSLVGGLVGVAALSVLIALSYARQVRRAEAAVVLARDNEAQALLTGAWAARAAGDPLAAVAQVRSSLELSDTPAARALWSQLVDEPLRWHLALPRPYAVAFSPTGSQLAVGGEAGVVRLVDPRLAQEVEHLRHPEAIAAVGYAADGEVVYTGDYAGLLRAWDAGTGELLREARLVGDYPLAFHAGVDGVVVRGRGREGRLYAWTDAVELLGEAPLHNLAALHPDRTRLATTSKRGGELLLWDLTSGDSQVLGRVPSEHRLEVLAFHPDGVLAGLGEVVTQWSVPDGEVLAQYPAPASVDGGGVAGGRLVALVAQELVVWEGRSGRVVHRASLTDYPEFQTRVRLGAVSPDGQTLGVVTDDGLSLFSTVSPPPPPDRGHRDVVERLALSGPWLASGGGDGTVRLWSHDGQPGAQRALSAATVAHVLAPDATWGAASAVDGALMVYEPAEGAVLSALDSREETTGLAASADRLAVADWRGLVRLFDTTDPTAPSETWRALILENMLCVDLSTEGTRVVAGLADGRVAWWSLPSDQPRFLDTHRDMVASLALGPDGRLLTGSYDGTVGLWDLDAGTGGLIGADFKDVGQVAWHPDGDRAAWAGTGGRVVVYDLETGEHRAWPAHRGQVYGVALSGDRVFTSGEDGAVRAWQLGTGQPAWWGRESGRDPAGVLTHRDAIGETHWSPEQLDALAGARDSSAGVAHLCVATTEGRLERWEPGGELGVALPGVEEVLAWGSTCLARAEGATVQLGSDGDLSELAAQGVHGLATTAEGPVLLGAEHLLLPGSPPRTYALDARPTAVADLGGRWLVAYERGGVALLEPGTGTLAPGPPLVEAPSSWVSVAVAGPADTAFLGFATGEVGLWDLRGGLPLYTAKLHGRVIALLPEGDRLLALSDLGDQAWLDRAVFTEGSCAFLERVRSTTPVAWERGQVRVAPALPLEHPCRP